MVLYHYSCYLVYCPPIRPGRSYRDCNQQNAGSMVWCQQSTLSRDTERKIFVQKAKGQAVERQGMGAGRAWRL